MRSIGVLEALFLLTFIGGIWFSVNAKPLGGRPYRWGTYVGIMNGLFALSMPLMVLREKTMASLVGGILFASAFAAVSVGLLYRRRFGVVGYLGLSVIIELGVL